MIEEWPEPLSEDEIASDGKDCVDFAGARPAVKNKTIHAMLA
jgi:hypothetical protein